ncbi:hypothetical protein JCM30204_30650 [Dysgonomonas termitidis]
MTGITIFASEFRILTDEFPFRYNITFAERLIAKTGNFQLEETKRMFMLYKRIAWAACFF